MDLAYSLTGLLVGVLVGLTGVGGGSIMTPVLIYGFGIPPIIAVGTDLLFAATTKLGATVLHARSKTVRWNTVGWLALGSLPTTALVLYWLKQYITSGVNYTAFITTLLGITLVITAIALLFKNKLTRFATTHRTTSTTLKDPRYAHLSTVLAGAVMGFLVSITSVGAGALGVVALLLLYSHLSSREIVGTDIAHATLLAGLAGIGHAQMGTVDFILLGQLLLGSIPGIYIGTKLCSRVSESLLRTVLATVLLAVGLRFSFVA